MTANRRQTWCPPFFFTRDPAARRRQCNGAPAPGCAWAADGARPQARVGAFYTRRRVRRCCRRVRDGKSLISNEVAFHGTGYASVMRIEPYPEETNMKLKKLAI